MQYMTYNDTDNSFDSELYGKKLGNFSIFRRTFTQQNKLFCGQASFSESTKQANLK